MSNFPSVRPSLNLQFDSQPTPADMTSHLASVGATFSRASVGTYVDANGLIQEATAGQARPNYSSAGVHEGLLIEESRTNIHKASEDFSTNNYIFTDATIEINKGISPNGTASADAWVSPSGDFSPSIRQSYVLSSGVTYTFSIFAKANGYNFLRINAFFGSTDSSWFNLSTGELGTIGATSTAKIEDYGNGWYRCSITRTQSGVGLQAAYIAGTPTDNTVSYTGDGESGILIWGAQMEVGSFSTSYIPTIPTFDDRDSVATFLGSNGLIQTASVDVARSDTYVYVDDVLTEAGLLLEGSAENLITSSEDFSTNWNGAGIGAGTSPVVTVNQAIAPDGTASADKIFFDAGGTTSSDRSQLSSNTTSVTLGNTYTSQIYLKGDSGGEIINIRHANGISFTSFTLTTEWQKCVVTETVSSSTASRPLTLRSLGSNQQTATVYAWGAQLEEDSQATSYFPTEHSFTSRASTATFFNASGVLSTASTDVARTDHKYIGGEWLEAGLLLEDESVNYAKASEDLDNTTYWITSRTTVTADTEIDPKGGTNSYLVSETTDTGSHWFGGQSAHAQAVAIGETWTMSVFVKKGDGANAPDIMQLGWGSGGFGSSVYANFNITTNVVTDIGSGLDSAKIEDFEDWKRISITATASANDSDAARLFLYFTNNNPNATQNSNYTGQTNANVFVWGVQVEQQSQPTSYIPTTTASTTRSADVYTTATKVRSADVCYIDGTAFSDFYNDDSGTMFFNARTNDPDGSTSNYKAPFVLKDSTANPGIDFTSINLETSGTNEAYIRGNVGGNGTGGLLLGTFTFADFVKGAEVIDATANSGIINGGTVANDTTFPFDLTGIGINKLQIGYHLHTDTYLDGSIKKLIYFPRRLSDNELKKLTQ